MRIREIGIKNWRHFSDIDLQLHPDAGLVCIVGANGTGKSHILELIGACAHRLGLSQGIDIPRGDPFNDHHEFHLRFFLAPGVSDAVESLTRTSPEFAGWDRTITIRSKRSESEQFEQVAAGGVESANGVNVATQIISRLRDSKDVHFLSLDADRAYPKKNINVNEIAQAYDIDWEGAEYTRGRSFRSTAMLYDEWLKYFLAQENQSGTRLIKEIRRARQSGAVEPGFDDHFSAYKESLLKVLPHVVFTGVDSRRRTLLFDTTGMELTFDQLSGGEREIGFLVGQIDRFGLREGLFLLDEPELHLNADLIRAWVSYLTSTVSTGQIWLATHSLEAIEAAGQQATFILERDDLSKKVSRISRLDSRPVLSALSRAVGTPAFSISQLRFVFVEGEESVGERERFRKLSGMSQNARFMECGSCQEVIRRVAVIRALATETDSGIRIGGVIDRDFRPFKAVQQIVSDLGVHVLAVHEIENFFLDPTTLARLQSQNGNQSGAPLELIQAAADARAGNWIFQYAMAQELASGLPEIANLLKVKVKQYAWGNIEENTAAFVSDIVQASQYANADASKLQGLIEIGLKAYTRKRAEPTLWKECEGKQILNCIAARLGFADSTALSSAAFVAWERGEISVPTELQEFRTYLGQL